MALPNPLEAFVWGAGGARMTPDEVAREREVAEALLAQGIDTSPVAHPLQGLARVATAAAGAYRRNKADSAYKSGREGATSKIAKILSGVTGAAPPKASTPSPSKAASIPQGERAAYIREGLIKRGLPEHVADGFLLNFQDESGLDPGINEKNPIVPGSRGGFGLYQLTGPRRRAYEQYAAQRGIPLEDVDGQLDFMMGELQGPEANAYKSIMAAQDTGGAATAILKDFLRPAAEHQASRSARYMQAGGDPVQVASLDPSVGMPQQEPSGYDVFEQPVLGPTPPEATIQGQDITPQPDQWAGMRDPVQQVAQAMPQQDPAPVQMAQAGPTMEQLIDAASEPYLSDGERAVVNAMLEQQMQQNDPYRQLQMQKMQQEIEAASGPQYKVVPGRDGAMFRVDERAGTVEQIYGGKPDTFRTLTPEEEIHFGLDPAGAYQMGADNKISKIGGEGTTVNIDQRAEGAFEKNLAEKQAAMFSTMATEGLNARADLAVIGELESLLKGQGGMGTGLLGWLAQKGVDVGDATSDLQAAQALINKLVPTQRQAGSGSMSDRDVELFTRSLPSLWNTPGGNEKIIKVMRGLAQYKADQGEIADMVEAGEMTRQEGRKALRGLKNPLEGFEPPAAPKGGEKRRLKYNPQTGEFE